MTEIYNQFITDGYIIKVVIDDNLVILKDASSKKIVVFTQDGLSDEAIKHINYDMCTHAEVRVIRVEKNEFKQIKGF